MKSLEIQLYEWNKKICNKYNPYTTAEILYRDSKNIYIKLYIRRNPKNNFTKENFNDFFRVKDNSKLFGGILKKLINEYGMEPTSGSIFKGFYNSDNWKLNENGFLEYVYHMTKR